jgi:single-strand selective monofunctional uracil DNA glycosylase
VELIRISRRLADACDTLSFSEPVTHVYNPLRYAQDSVEQYLTKYGKKTGRVVLLGMNPGPWGMAQTGVPFGEVSFVRDWMGLDAKVHKPEHEHPKRPVLGLDCQRSEVSGARMWGWAKERFGPARSFFSRFFVLNYCPLSFMEEGGRNVTPDKLPKEERTPLFEICNAALRETIDALAPKMIVGVGAFARKQAERVVGDRGIEIGQMLHPSPASPKANRGWASAAEADLRGLGIEVPE